MVVLLWTERWVANHLSSSNDLTEGEQTDNLDEVSTISEEFIFGRGLGEINQLIGRSLWVTGEFEGLLVEVGVHFLEVGNGWWGQTFSNVNLLSELNGDFAPVNKLAENN
ncbi:hypothetical protein OGAPHI_007018 [Ogataea philodendri]|uniref:Uncharacterized protein n=1 Tax=Ogataea philodendri TaxID=1378263 RepID=A0A9P8NWE0_9ASCO|nr:uncharacterized protein OGAPHI_007018 [Ogataea philodendri]KAH3660432.1 hypothetical protein OGAPHI_007018 [Ogataea philodendri]